MVYLVVGVGCVLGVLFLFGGSFVKLVHAVQGS